MKAPLLALVALLGLLALTVGIAFLPLGYGNPWLLLALSALQAAVIVGAFTEWRAGDVPTRLALLVGVVWLALLLLLVGIDVGFRPPGTLFVR